jgi:hypothetical protein
MRETEDCRSHKRKKTVEEIYTALERKLIYNEPINQGYVCPGNYDESVLSSSQDYGYSKMQVDNKNKNNKNNDKENNVLNKINKTVLDSYLYILFVNSNILSEFEGISTTQIAEEDLRINKKCTNFLKLYILKNLCCIISVRLDVWEMLLLTLTLNGAGVLGGFSQVATQRDKPKFKKGKGVIYVNCNCNKQNQVLAILTKPSNCFLKWSGRYRLL